MGAVNKEHTRTPVHYFSPPGQDQERLAGVWVLWRCKPVCLGLGKAEGNWQVVAEAINLDSSH